MKKFLIWLFLFLYSIILVKADVNMIWNTWTFQVNPMSILVWDVNKDTDVKWLFWKIIIDWQLISEDKLLLNLDLRYVSQNVDKKVFDINDKIPQWSKLYILFKTMADGWSISENSNILIETKNVTLLEYWNISTSWNNTYDVLGKVYYSDESKSDNVISEPLKTIDTQIIEQNNTWIKDNSYLILFLLLILWILFYLPNKKHIW